MHDEGKTRSPGAWRLGLSAVTALLALAAVGGLLAAAGARAFHWREQAERQTALEADALARDAGQALADLARAREEQIRARDDQAHIEAAAAVEVLRRRVEKVLRDPPAAPARPALSLASVLSFMQGVAEATAEEEAAEGDWAVERLRTALRAEPLAGCSYAVYEDLSKLLLQVGGDGGGNAVAASRDYAFHDGKRFRFWTLQASVGVPETPLPLTAREAAEALSRSYGSPDILAGADEWQGFLADGEGKVAAVFPAGDPSALTVTSTLAAAAGAAGRQPSAGGGGLAVTVPSAERAALTDWQPLGTKDGTETVSRVLRGGSTLPAEWGVGIAVAMKRPGLWAATTAEIADDPRWGAALAVGVVFVAASWAWMVSLFRARRRAMRGVGEASRRPLAADDAMEPAGSADRLAAADRRGAAATRAWLARQPEPGSSLRRVQALHRGAAERGGSRVLDHARSPLLRELAQRVRPGGAAKAAVRAKGGKAVAGGSASTTTATAARTAVMEPVKEKTPRPAPSRMTSEEIVGELMRRK